MLTAQQAAYIIAQCCPLITAPKIAFVVSVLQHLCGSGRDVPLESVALCIVAHLAVRCGSVEEFFTAFHRNVKATILLPAKWTSGLPKDRAVQSWVGGQLAVREDALIALSTIQDNNCYPDAASSVNYSTQLQPQQLAAAESSCTRRDQVEITPAKAMKTPSRSESARDMVAGYDVAADADEVATLTPEQTALRAGNSRGGVAPEVPPLLLGSQQGALEADESSVPASVLHAAMSDAATLFLDLPQPLLSCAVRQAMVELGILNEKDTADDPTCTTDNMLAVFQHVGAMMDRGEMTGAPATQTTPNPHTSSLRSGTELGLSSVSFDALPLYIAPQVAEYFGVTVRTPLSSPHTQRNGLGVGNSRTRSRDERSRCVRAGSASASASPGRYGTDSEYSDREEEAPQTAPAAERSGTKGSQAASSQKYLIPDRSQAKAPPDLPPEKQGSTGGCGCCTMM